MTGEEIHVPAGRTKGEVMSRAQRILYAVMRALIEGACRVWFRLEVHGAEHLPPTAPTSSRRSTAPTSTPLSCSAITTRRLRYMGKESLWSSRALGWLLTALGGFPSEPRHRRP